MHVFTTVTDSYKYSAELNLFMNMFKKALPAEVGMTILNRVDRPVFDILRDEIIANLEDGDLPEYILVVREPSVYIGLDAVSIMKDLLSRKPELDCAVPSDYQYLPDGCSIEYFSPYGFERFAEKIRERFEETTPFNKSGVFMFLVRTAVFRTMELPKNIFSLPEMLGDRTTVASRAYIHPLFDYYNETRDDILPLIPDAVQSVLDIGCARGGFGEFLKERRPCRVVGVEMNSDEGNKARVFLDRVIIGDVLTVEPGERFDCVTCLDVLEHFENPERLLKKIRDDFLYRERGSLIVSIPNVGHWSVVEDLLAGRWDYHPSGLLCNTHLRFFTLNTIRDLLEDNGFFVEKIERIKSPMPKTLKNRMQELNENGMHINILSLETLTYNVVGSVIN